MYDYEKLGVFYMGRSFDIEAGKTGTDPILYDSRISRPTRSSSA